MAPEWKAQQRTLGWASCRSCMADAGWGALRPSLSHLPRPAILPALSHRLARAYASANGSGQLAAVMRKIARRLALPQRSARLLHTAQGTSIDPAPASSCAFGAQRSQRVLLNNEEVRVNAMRGQAKDPGGVPEMPGPRQKSGLLLHTTHNAKRHLDAAANAAPAGASASRCRSMSLHLAASCI